MASLLAAPYLSGRMCCRPGRDKGQPGGLPPLTPAVRIKNAGVPVVPRRNFFLARPPCFLLLDFSRFVGQPEVAVKRLDE